MDKETINRTFESASTIICQQWLDDRQIDLVEVMTRLQRARRICVEEYRKHLGLDVDPVMVNK